MNSRAIKCTVAGPLLVLLSGCTERTVHGETIVYMFPWSTIVLTLVTCAAVAFFFFALCAMEKRWRLGLLFATLWMGVACFVFAVMLSARASLSESRIEFETGLPWSPNRISIDLTQVQEVSVTRDWEWRCSRSCNWEYHDDLHFRSLDANQTIPVGTLLDNGPVDELLKIARSQGIAVFDHRTPPPSSS